MAKPAGVAEGERGGVRVGGGLDDDLSGRMVRSVNQ